jgi:hypothetical protein
VMCFSVIVSDHHMPPSVARALGSTLIMLVAGANVRVTGRGF